MFRYIKRKCVEWTIARVYSAVPIRQLKGNCIELFNDACVTIPEHTLSRFLFPRNLDGRYFYRYGNDSCNSTFVVLKQGEFTGVILREIENNVYQAINTVSGKRYKDFSEPHYYDVHTFMRRAMSNSQGWINY